MADQIPIAIDGIEDPSEIRLVLYQSGRLVHTPLQQLIDAIADINGSALLLEGDESGLGLSLLLLEGDQSGVLLLEGTY